ncbi:MAG: hypothetical protein JO192_03140 [Candidatus Eremiobacteraeota bacterium]|nr:hypothetical protein [Candidatus Eremiobacteraeota bacterium]
MDPLVGNRYREGVQRLTIALAAAGLLGCLALVPARADQTFWQLSSGPAPSPWPTPTAWPVTWYGSLYYPLYWPICERPAIYRCRPPHAHLWPPPIPHGQHAVGAPKPPR